MGKQTLGVETPGVFYVQKNVKSLLYNIDRIRRDRKG